ncbi:MAG: hypothetical protein KatS3mg057_2514 [Herpetosiphonaceae bacterium]|nr:MAG: hypothetical protein KatS3mg057_2514 [Herpetosiphonaceae bacterium]
MDERAAERQRMVEKQLRPRGISDIHVLAAMAEVPRHRFIPNELQDRAYDDGALPIAAGQTISQPFIVALMAQELLIQPDDRVLEIGTGSGYAAAVLSRLAAQVYTVERYPELAAAAQERFHELGYRNIQVRIGDGSLGWPEFAPYARISVAAAAPNVPKPLLDQLVDGGHLVLPLGSRDEQWLIRLTRKGPHIIEQRLCPVRFVPLVGDWGWNADHRSDNIL